MVKAPTNASLQSCASSNNWIKVNPYIASFDPPVLLVESLFVPYVTTLPMCVEFIN